MNTQSDDLNMRIEKDSMGAIKVAKDALYGASTQRAKENFEISNLKFSKRFVSVLAQIKRCAALANLELGLLDEKLALAIADGAKRIASGEFFDQFVVDIFQTGSGTSTNMNANELVANIANLSLGGKVGSKSPVHPNDHVNLGQSSNDVIPSAMHIACALEVQESLLVALKKLEKTLYTKSEEFFSVVKTGRTHLQDATPISLGQEFDGYKNQVAQSYTRIEKALEEISQVALGGTAVGTGINTHKEFASLTLKKLSSFVGHEFCETNSHFSAQSTLDGALALSGALRSYAASMMKVVNDIRFLGSGPRAGIGELALPEVQPGSSIMPGKVNPVIAESFGMVCAKVFGNDTTVTFGAQSGNFELNVMMPVVTYCLLESIELLTNATNNFEKRCVSGIKATEHGPKMVKQGLSIGTALAPIVGYDKATEIVKEASKTGESIHQVALRKTDLDEQKLNTVLDPKKMVEM